MGFSCFREWTKGVLNNTLQRKYKIIKIFLDIQLKMCYNIQLGVHIENHTSSRFFSRKKNKQKNTLAIEGGTAVFF